MTPIEETIQRLMEPDKQGDKGFPTRTSAFGDYFGHPVQRTLDALWKFAEGADAASRDSADRFEQALTRIKVLEQKNTSHLLALNLAQRLLGGIRSAEVDDPIYAKDFSDLEASLRVALAP